MDDRSLLQRHLLAVAPRATDDIMAFLTPAFAVAETGRLPLTRCHSQVEANQAAVVLAAATGMARSRVSWMSALAALELDWQLLDGACALTGGLARTLTVTQYQTLSKRLPDHIVGLRQALDAALGKSLQAAVERSLADYLPVGKHRLLGRNISKNIFETVFCGVCWTALGDKMQTAIYGHLLNIMLAAPIVTSSVPAAPGWRGLPS